MNDLVPVLLVFREEDFGGNSYYDAHDCAVCRATKRLLADESTEITAMTKHVLVKDAFPELIGDPLYIAEKFENPELPLPDPILIYLPKKYLKEAPAEKSYEEKTERMTK